MNAVCTYLIQLRGQVNEAEINAISLLPLTVEWGDATVTLFTTSADQTDLIRMMRHLHKQGFIFLSINCKR